MHGADAETQLVTLDRRTLRLRGRILRLHDAVAADTDAAATSATGQVSPDGKTLAVGGSLGQVLLVDPARLRRVGAIRLPHGTDVVDVDSWPRPDRLLVVYGRFSVQNTRGDSVAIVDPVARRVVRRRRLFGFVWHAEKQRDGSLVLAVGPLRSRAGLRVVVVSASGAIRSVALPQEAPARGIRVGGRYFPALRPPALTTDGAGRIFVVADGEPLREIDARTLRIREHRVELTTRSLGLPRPPAHLPGSAEPQLLRSRSPVWLGHGLLGVAGAVERPALLGGGMIGARYQPYGFQVIDTRTWRSVRTLPLTSCSASFGLFLCSQSVGGFAPDGKGSRGSTLLAYDRRWKLLYRNPSPTLWRQEIAGRLLAGRPDGSSIWELDGRTGAVMRRLGRIPVWPPDLLDWKAR